MESGNWGSFLKVAEETEGRESPLEELVIFPVLTPEFDSAWLRPVPAFLYPCQAGAPLSALCLGEYPRVVGSKVFTA